MDVKLLSQLLRVESIWTAHSEAEGSVKYVATNQAPNYVMRNEWLFSPIPWLKTVSAWSTPAGRYEMKRSKLGTGEHSTLHQLLVSQTEARWIYRQEAVSMLPVEVLNIEPTDSVSVFMVRSSGGMTHAGAGPVRSSGI